MWLLAVLALVGCVALGTAAVGGALVARHRAASAADLAALAAADAAVRADPDPCGLAARVAGRNGAVVTECVLRDLVVDVRVEVRVGGLFGAGRSASVRARAGPAWSVP